MTEKDRENKNFYNRIHFFGYEDDEQLRKEYEDFLDDQEDDDEDDILISENF